MYDTDPRPQTFLAADGTQLAYYQAGQGPDVVMIHGFSISAMSCYGKQSDWVVEGFQDQGRVDGPPMLEGIAEAGARVTTFDVRGHGRTGAAPVNGMATLLQDVRALLDHTGISRADVFGYSMGGIITAHLAADGDPRIRSAIIGGVGAYVLAGRPSPLRPDVPELLISDAETEYPEVAAYRALAAVDPGADMPTMGRVYGALLEQVDPQALRQTPFPLLLLTSREDETAPDADEFTQDVPITRAGGQNGSHVEALRNRAYLDELTTFLRQVWQEDARAAGAP